MTVSKYSELPPTLLTPVGVHRIANRTQITAAMSMAKILTHVLKHHQDPVVVQSIKELEEVCINPWIRLQVKTLENDPSMQIGEEIDQYDLTLPTGTRTATIGSSSTCEARLPENAASSYHVRVSAQDKDGDVRWVAEVREPLSDDNFHASVVKHGDQTYEKSRSQMSRHYGDRVEFVVKPGDVLEIGTSHILLHAPEPETTSAE